MTTGRNKGPRALPRAALPTGPAALLIADAEERAALEPVLKAGGLALTTRLIDIREFDLENFLLDLEDAFEGPLARTAVVVVAADLLVDARIDIINLLDQILEPGRPILVSCSQATATEQSALADHPERIVGFSMLPLLGGHRVIEVAGTARTDPAIVERVRALFQAGGLVAHSVEDRPGLVLARILAPIVHEAANALDEGVASAHAIDDAMRLGAEWPFGPLRLGRWRGTTPAAPGYGVLAAKLRGCALPASPHYPAARTLRHGGQGLRTGLLSLRAGSTIPATSRPLTRPPYPQSTRSPLFSNAL